MYSSWSGTAIAGVHELLEVGVGLEDVASKRARLLCLIRIVTGRVR